MKNEELKEKLRKAGLNKKQFATLVGLQYQTVINWGSSKNIPHWVDSWLELYAEAQKSMSVKKAIKESGLCN